MVDFGAAAPSAIVRASVSSLPEALKVLWRKAGWVLEDAAVVDARHLVLAFRVDHSSSIIGTGIAGQLTKYTDHEDHAPYCAGHLKLATLRHFREQHGDLEGTWDPMEGRIRITSTLEEMCRRHGAPSVSQGAHLVTTDVVYQTDDTSFIYSTSRAENLAPRNEHWEVVSRIRDVAKLALLLGAEFARQCDEGQLTAVTGLDRLVTAAVRSSGLNSVVHVHHGPVIYDDNSGETLFKRFPEHVRGVAAHFFKRAAFEYQQEYRFVLSARGGRPVEDEFYLKITPELRAEFRRPGE